MAVGFVAFNLRGGDGLGLHHGAVLNHVDCKRIACAAVWEAIFETQRLAAARERGRSDFACRCGVVAAVKAGSHCGLVADEHEVGVLVRAALFDTGKNAAVFSRPTR